MTRFQSPLSLLLCGKQRLRQIQNTPEYIFICVESEDHGRTTIQRSRSEPGGQGSRSR
jgi:hypothetical protein